MILLRESNTKSSCLLLNRWVLDAVIFQLSYEHWGRECIAPLRLLEFPSSLCRAQSGQHLLRNTAQKRLPQGLRNNAKPCQCQVSRTMQSSLSALGEKRKLLKCSRLPFTELPPLPGPASVRSCMQWQPSSPQACQRQY